jgi:transcriptional/translational regulatory protein YebC/TACO1
MQSDGETYQILTSPEDFMSVLDEVKGKGLEPISAEIAMIPQNIIKLEGGAAAQMLKLYEALDDQEDVQNVYTNFEPDEAAAQQQA